MKFESGRKRNNITDNKFYRYYLSKVRGAKFAYDIVYWFIVSILAGVISEFYFTVDTCKNSEASLLAEAAFLGNGSVLGQHSFWGDWSQRLCSMETLPKAWAAAWVISTLIRIPFLIRQAGLVLNGELYLTRLDGKDWNLKNAFLYGVIEWLPALLGATYVFVFHLPANLFSVGGYVTIVVAAQLIWLAPVLFRFHDRNLVEIITGVTVEATEKKYKAIEKSYSNTFERRLNNVFFGLNNICYILVTGLFVFSVVQMLRIPEQNSAYQEMLFGGYKPLWENNIYFAIEGVSAPADVHDFYQYGLKKAQERYKLFELLKQRSGIDKKYLYEIPASQNLPVVLDQAQELKITDEDWKNLDCLYDLGAQQNEQCATFSDWKSYVEQNKIMWERYNRAPDFGNAYVVPPQFLGSNIIDTLQLAELKAVHIIYLAENGSQREAMQEWLKYMNLYKAMAGSRETSILKAVIEKNIGMQLVVLEKLLNIAPDLTSTYQQDILKALKSDEPIFPDPYIMADAWGAIEPFLYIALGNANAMQNEFFKCMEGFKDLAEKPLDEYPYSDENTIVCPLQESGGVLEMAFVYTATKPGYYPVNVIYSLVYDGILKSQILLKKNKITQVRFIQAQLSVAVLSQNIPASEIGDFVKSVPANLQNPITNKPFEWDEERKCLFFERPDSKKRINWCLNIKKTVSD